MASVTATIVPVPLKQSVAWRWSIIALLTVAMVISYVNRVNLSFALLDANFKHVFQFTNSQRGLLNSAFFWSYAALQIPAGWVVDRYGTKYPVLVSFTVWSLLTAVTAATTGFASLFLIRLLLGVGEAAIQPAGIRWIGLNFPERRRGLAIGVFMSGTKFGPAVGAAASAWLIETEGWRAMFLLLGLVALIWVVPWLALMKNDSRAAAVARGVPHAVHADVPMAKLLANPIILGTIIGTFSYMYFVYFCITWMPAFLSEARGLSLGSSGLYTTFSFAGMATVAIIGGWAADRIIAGGRDAIAVRKAFTIVGFLLASTEVFVAVLPLNLALVVSIVSLSGLGLATANYWALTQSLIPGNSIGRIVGIQNCAANLPGIVAPILTGWLVDKTGSYTAPMVTVLVFLVTGILAYLFLVREKYSPARAALIAG